MHRQCHLGKVKSSSCSNGLGATYDVHLRLIGKCVVDFLLVLIEVFTLGVTSEVLSEYQLIIN